MAQLSQTLHNSLRAALAAPDALLLGQAAEVAARDHSFHPAHNPSAVCLPGSISEVVAVVRACAAHRVPITPRGAGTGIEGGAIPVHGGVVLDVSRLKSMRVLANEGQAVVGAGVLKLELAKALRPHGLLFGPDPSSNPSIGGMASTSGSGMTTLRYGTTRENVLSMLVVTPQGDLLRTRTPVRKSATGLDLNNLYIGSEGTLGVIVELTLRLHRAPAARCGAVIPFRSLDLAAEAVLLILAQRAPTLLRCELLNAEGVRVTNDVFKTTLLEKPTLFLEFAGDSLSVASSDAAACLASISGGAAAPPVSAEGDALDELWEARRGCYLAASRWGGRTPGARTGAKSVVVTDVCVPLAALPEAISATEEDFNRSGFPAIICAHVADGNFHCLIPYLPAEKPAVMAVEHRLIERALRLGGTVSGEHGVGLGKMHHICSEHGPVHIGVQRAIKEALDPAGLCNPGKMLLSADEVAAAADSSNRRARL